MKIKKAYIFYLLFAFFILYGLNSTVFERRFFVNELLSVSGLFLFLFQVFLQPARLGMMLPKSPIFRWILLLQILCLYHLIASVFFKTNWHFYLRNSVIFYSIFSFYLGFFGLKFFRVFIQKAKYFILAYVLYGLVWPAEDVLDRFTTAAFFPLLFKQMKWPYVFIVMALNVVLAKQYESMTVVLISLLLLGLYIIPNFRWFKSLLLAGGLAAVLGFGYFVPNFALQEEGEYSLFGNTHKVMASDPLLNKDGNSTWRAVFWYRVLTERFPENMIGIGFGTPLLKYNHGSNTVISGNDDLHDIHVSGAHNTYLTLFLRLGLLFLVIMGFVFRAVFSDFYHHKKYYAQTEAGMIFLAFFSVAIIGLFNLVLESPMAASLFWGFLGLVAALIEERKINQA